MSDAGWLDRVGGWLGIGDDDELTEEERRRREERVSQSTTEEGGRGRFVPMEDVAARGTGSGAILQHVPVPGRSVVDQATGQIEPNSVGENLLTGLENYGDVMTFGTRPYLQAAMETSDPHLGSPDETWSDAADRIRQDASQRTEENPLSAVTGTVAGIGASLLGGGAGTAAGVGRGANLLNRVVQGTARAGRGALDPVRATARAVGRRVGAQGGTQAAAARMAGSRAGQALSTSGRIATPVLQQGALGLTETGIYAGSESEAPFMSEQWRDDVYDQMEAIGPWAAVAGLPQTIGRSWQAARRGTSPAARATQEGIAALRGRTNEARAAAEALGAPPAALATFEKLARDAAGAPTNRLVELYGRVQSRAPQLFGAAQLPNAMRARMQESLSVAGDAAGEALESAPVASRLNLDRHAANAAQTAESAFARNAPHATTADAAAEISRARELLSGLNIRNYEDLREANNRMARAGRVFAQEGRVALSQAESINQRANQMAFDFMRGAETRALERTLGRGAAENVNAARQHHSDLITLEPFFRGQRTPETGFLAARFLAMGLMGGGGGGAGLASLLGFEGTEGIGLGGGLGALGGAAGMMLYLNHLHPQVRRSLPALQRLLRENPEVIPMLGRRSVGHNMHDAIRDTQAARAVGAYIMEVNPEAGREMAVDQLRDLGFDLEGQPIERDDGDEEFPMDFDDDGLHAVQTDLEGNEIVPDEEGEQDEDDFAFPLEF